MYVYMQTSFYHKGDADLGMLHESMHHVKCINLLHHIKDYFVEFEEKVEKKEANKNKKYSYAHSKDVLSGMNNEGDLDLSFKASPRPLK